MSNLLILAVCVVATFSAAVQGALLRPRQTTSTCINAANPPSASDATALLNLHNSYRASDAAAYNKVIPNLLWDNGLALLAQGWSDDLASRAAFAHGNDKLCNGTKLGQNIYYAGNSNRSALTPTAAVVSWNNEKVDYDYATNTCRLNKVCGHYTQNVWAKTKLLGCGVSYYTSSTGMPRVLVVCNYFPPGNYIGQSPF